MSGLLIWRYLVLLSSVFGFRRQQYTEITAQAQCCNCIACLNHHKMWFPSLSLHVLIHSMMDVPCHQEGIWELKPVQVYYSLLSVGCLAFMPFFFFFLTELHAFLHCPAALAVWEGTALLIISGKSVQTTWTYCYSCISETEVTIAGIEISSVSLTLQSGCALHSSMRSSLSPISSEPSSIAEVCWLLIHATLYLFETGELDGNMPVWAAPHLRAEQMCALATWTKIAQLYGGELEKEEGEELQPMTEHCIILLACVWRDCKRRQLPQ